MVVRWGDKQVGGSEDYLDKNKDNGKEGDQSPRNATYKENLTLLEKFVMLSFTVSEASVDDS